MKPTKIFVKPARPGMNLRHPVSGLLPDTGRSWVNDAFTQRRIADGGIVEASRDGADTEDADGPVAATPAKAPAAPLANVPGPGIPPVKS